MSNTGENNNLFAMSGLFNGGVQKDPPQDNVQNNTQKQEEIVNLNALLVPEGDPALEDIELADEQLGTGQQVNVQNNAVNKNIDTDTNPNNSGNNSKLGDIWDYLKNKYEGFEVPNEVTPENQYDLLLEQLSNGLTNGLLESIKDPILSDAVQRSLQDPNFDFNEYLNVKNQHKDMLSMGDSDIIKHTLINQYGGMFDKDNNPDGITDEEIQSYISNLEQSGKLSLEAKSIRRALRENKDKMEARQNEIRQQQQLEYQKKWRADVDNVKNKMATKKDIFGIEISENEIREFNNKFESLITPNEKGVTPLSELLSNDELLYSFLYLATHGKDKTTNLQKQAQNAQQIIDKLDRNPQKFGADIETGRKLEIDLSALANPEI